MVVFFYFLYCYTSDLALAYDDDNKDCHIKKNQTSSPLPRASFTSHLMLMQYSDLWGTILEILAAIAELFPLLFPFVDSVS